MGRSILRAAAATIICLVAGTACDDVETGVRAASVLDGEVWFLGPVPDARVVLYRLDAAGQTTYETETRTDAHGHFRIEGIEVTGDFLAVSDIDGIAFRDPHTGRDGAYAHGTSLRAPIEGLDLLQERPVRLTPLSTLLVAVGEGLRGAGAEFPLRDAHAAFNEWLTLDPVASPIGEPRSGQSEARRHRLLLEGLSALAAHAANDAGLTPGTSLTADRLLSALADDGRGPPPPRFDGRGDAGPLAVRAGPGSFPLTAQTLRARYAEAVRDRLRADAWAGLTEGDVADLLGSLRCTATPFFEACADDGTDRTPPAIGAPSPAPGSSVAGVITIQIAADDPETGIDAMTLARLPGDGLAPVPLEDLDDRPGVARAAFDTRTLVGRPIARFRAAATNRDGVEASLDFELTLANHPVGQLTGHVIKGPARGVVVEASALRPDGSDVPLGRATTAADGAFSMTVHEWRGPVILRAQGVVDGDTVSTYRDEARGRALSWDVTQTLTAVLPDFDPAAAIRPVVVTPLTDLAWARARGLAAQRGHDLLESYGESLGLIARHFGLSDAGALLHVRPASAEQPVTPPPTENVRYLLVLGCLSQRSLDLSLALDPRAPDGITALDLVAALREDVQSDPWFDGRRGTEPLLVGRGGAAVPLGDGLRADLATACARWLSQQGSALGLPVAMVADDLERMSRATNDLFAADLATRSFDDGAPAVEVELRVEDGVLEDAGADAPASVSGRLSMEVRATDLAGVRSIAVTAPDMETAMRVVETPQPASGESGDAVWQGEIDTRVLGDGPYALEVTVTDVLGNEASRRLTFVVDNTAPALGIGLPIGVTLHEGRWYTNARRLVVPVRLEDAAPGVRAVARLGGSEAAVEGGAVELPLPDQEGIHRLEVSATDPLGNASRVELAVAVDRTPPTLEQRPTSYVDEAPLDADRDLASAPRISLVGPGPIPLRKWQDRWDEESDNPIVFRWEVQDAESGGAGTAPARLDLTWSVQIGPDVEATSQPVVGDGSRALTITADGLRFDPLRAPPPRQTVARAEVRLSDLAGNSVAVPHALLLDVLPPPPRTTVSVSSSFDAASGFDASFLSPGDEDRGAPLVEIRITVTNPHRLPVRLALASPDTVALELAVGTGLLAQTTTTMTREQIDHRGQRIEASDDVVELRVNARINDAPLSGREVLDVCSILTAISQGVYVHTPVAPDDIRFAMISYFLEGCPELTPAPTGTWTLRAPITIDSPDAPLSADGTLFLPPGTTRTLRLTATMPALPPELTDLLTLTEGPEGYEHVPYVRDLQNHLLYARPLDGELADRLCTTCFDGEPDCEVACQPNEEYIGYRVQALTDVRLRTWEAPEDAGRPWIIRTLSADGTLANDTGAIDPPRLRLRRDLDHWTDAPDAP